MRRATTQDAVPVGWLGGGEPVYAPIGEMVYDGDRALCHLCGRWFKMVGGSHTMSAHGITAAEYRELFHLRGIVSTAGPGTSQRKRRTMLEQIASGEREQPDGSERSAPSSSRWRSLGTRYPGLLREWHPTRNGAVDPFKTGPYAKRKVWWRCHECSHEWQASPHQRTSVGRGCPVCGRRRSIAATVERNLSRGTLVNRRLAVLRPDLLAEWHPAKNPGRDPERVAAGSEAKVWWRCPNEGCGNEWRAAIGDRTKRPSFGCPSCAARAAGQARAVAAPDRSFGALYPHLLVEWHPTANAGIDPYSLKPGSERRVWWVCAYCGHEWQAQPVARRRSPRGGCASCASRLRQPRPLSRPGVGD